MPVSQNSDNTENLATQRARVSLGGVPEAYSRLHSGFNWVVPEYFNIAQVCCARWAAQPDAIQKIAIHVHSSGAEGSFCSYAQLQEQANRLSNVLVAQGVVPGDRVAIVMPQCVETAVAYMAVLQMGAIAMPLSLLFGPDALEFRLQDSEAVIAIADESCLADLQLARKHCQLLRTVIGVGTPGAVLGQADCEFADTLAQFSTHFHAVQTRAEDPAILIYTSGTTGNPKGALLAHRALIGNLPGFVASQNWFGFDPYAGDPAAAPAAGQSGVGSSSRRTQCKQPDPRSQSIFWSPADWAWTGGLMDALLPTLYFGRPIVACNGRFSPQSALELMGACGVTHTFLFPTALKAMMKAYPGSPQHTVRQQFGLKLQAIMSAGEAVGDAVFAYCEQQLGVQPNEMFGQTEINYIVGNCNMQGAATLGTGVSLLPSEGAQPALGQHGGGLCASSVGWPSKPGSMGMGYPGHQVRVIDDAGNECPVGVPGDVALNRYDVHGQPNPIVFLGYWKNDAATRAKFTGKNGEGEWCRTGDIAVRDADGYLWYQGRSDDVFKAAGYRIGPGEIENCLVKHAAVANAAVVPKPDADRGALVKAYVVIAPDLIATCAGDTGATAQLHARLTVELQAHVKDLLAPYEYPKEIEFVDALPMTTTGKVQRRVLRLQEEERYAATRV